MILFILRSSGKKTYFQSSRKTTSYSGRIDTQSRRNDSGPGEQDIRSFNFAHNGYQYRNKHYR